MTEAEINESRKLTECNLMDKLLRKYRGLQNDEIKKRC